MHEACAIADWLTVLRSAETLRFHRLKHWDGGAQWLAYFDRPTDGPRCQQIVIDGDSVWFKADLDT